jgi:hypothetical protein
LRDSDDKAQAKESISDSKEYQSNQREEKNEAKGSEKKIIASRPAWALTEGKAESMTEAKQEVGKC